MFARPKRGYFIADVSDIRVIKAPVHKALSIKLPPEQDESKFDFSSNRTDSNNFQFLFVVFMNFTRLHHHLTCM